MSNLPTWRITHYDVAWDKDANVGRIRLTVDPPSPPFQTQFSGAEFDVVLNVLQLAAFTRAEVVLQRTPDGHLHVRTSGAL